MCEPLRTYLIRRIRLILARSACKNGLCSLRVQVREVREVGKRRSMEIDSIEPAIVNLFVLHPVSLFLSDVDSDVLVSTRSYENMQNDENVSRQMLRLQNANNCSCELGACYLSRLYLPPSIIRYV